MPPAANPTLIANVLNASASFSPNAGSPSAGTASSGSVAGDFAELMQGAIARQIAPTTTPAEGAALPTALPTTLPTPQAMLDAWQQLVAQSLQPGQSPSALHAQWQTLSQQVSAWLASGQTAGGVGSPAADDSEAVAALKNLQSLWSQWLAAPKTASTGGIEGLGAGTGGKEPASDLSLTQPTSGEMAWLAAMQQLASLTGTTGASSTANIASVGMAQAGVVQAGGAQVGMAQVGGAPGQTQQQGLGQFLAESQGQGADQTKTAVNGGQNSSFDAGLINRLSLNSAPMISATAQAVFAQLVSARSTETTASPERKAFDSVNELSILPTGYSVSNGISGTVPLISSSPVMLQQPNHAEQLGQNIQWLLGQNLSRANLSVHPEHLGPLQIMIDHKNEQTSIQITATHPMARELLDQQLPKLREWLQEAGLGNAQVTLNMGQFGQQNTGQSAGQSSRQFGSANGASGEGLSGIQAADLPTDSEGLSGRITRLGVDAFI